MDATDVRLRRMTVLVWVALAAAVAGLGVGIIGLVAASRTGGERGEITVAGPHGKTTIRAGRIEIQDADGRQRAAFGLSSNLPAEVSELELRDARDDGVVTVRVQGRPGADRSAPSLATLGIGTRSQSVELMGDGTLRFRTGDKSETLDDRLFALTVASRLP